MPQEYRVEKKINPKIFFVIVFIVCVITSISVFFVYEHIQNEKLLAFYDYVSSGDYDNASFVFRVLYEKEPFNYNILRAGIDLYYEILVRSDSDEFMFIAAERVIIYTKQILLSSIRAKRDYRIYQKLAYAYKSMGSGYYDESYNAYKKSLVYRDERIQTKIELASICYDLGFYDEAVVYYDIAKQSSKLEGADVLFTKEFEYQLAMSYYANNNTVKALDILLVLFDDALNTDIRHKSSLSLANIYRDSGLYNESKFYYDKTLEIDVKNPEVYYNMGVFYDILKKKTDAYRMYRTALSIDNSHEPSLEALYEK